MIFQVGFRDAEEEEVTAFGTYYVRAETKGEAMKKVLAKNPNASITYAEPFQPRVRRHLWWVKFWTLFGPYDDGDRTRIPLDEPTQYILREPRK